MGLGGTAQGATTVLALLLGVLALLVAVGLLLGVRKLSGRWLMGIVAALVWVAVVASVPVSDHYSALNREGRRASALRTEIARDTGAQVLSSFRRVDSCPGSGTGRTQEAVGSVRFGGADFRQGAERALRARGFTTSSGTVDDYGGPHRWVLGVRGRTSVSLRSSYQDVVDLEVEDGCSQLRPPRA